MASLLIPPRLGDHACAGRASSGPLDVLPHAAAHHEVKEITVVHHLSILAAGGIHPRCSSKRWDPRIVRAPLGRSREQSPACRGAASAVVVIVPFAQARRGRAAPAFTCPGSDLAHNCWHCRLVGLLSIYRSTMYMFREGVG